MTACSDCGRDGRRILYCHRTDCGKLAAAHPPSLDNRARYNLALVGLQGFAGQAQSLAAAAYAMSNDGDMAPGPRSAMLKIADLASELSVVIKMARPL